MDLNQNCFKPFLNINDYLKAVIITQQIYSNNKDNTDVIFDCVKFFISQPISRELLINFIHSVTTYKNLYPYHLMSNYESFCEEVYKYAIKTPNETITISSPAEKCYICNYKSITWFMHNNSVSQKFAILYAENRISMNTKYIL